MSRQLPPIRGVIFDVDGTLVDTNGIHIQAWEESFAMVGLCPARDVMARHIGMGGDRFVPHVVGEDAEKKFGVQLRQQYVEKFLQLIEQVPVRLFAGVEELFERLKQEKVPLALATSSKLEHFQAIERRCGVKLSAWARAIVTGSDVKATKPAPDLVLAAVAKLDLPADSCRMVGDTPWDVLSAKQAGVLCDAVLTGGYSRDVLIEAGARKVLSAIGSWTIS